MFPLVGILIGLLTGILAWGLSLAFPQAVVSVMLVAWMWWISSGLHMDGLSDTADGFFQFKTT